MNFPAVQHNITFGSSGLLSHTKVAINQRKVVCRLCNHAQTTTLPLGNCGCIRLDHLGKDVWFLSCKIHCKQISGRRPFVWTKIVYLCRFPMFARGDIPEISNINTHNELPLNVPYVMFKCWKFKKYPGLRPWTPQKTYSALQTTQLLIDRTLRDKTHFIKCKYFWEFFVYFRAKNAPPP